MENEISLTESASEIDSSSSIEESPVTQKSA